MDPRTATRPPAPLPTSPGQEVQAAAAAALGMVVRRWSGTSGLTLDQVRRRVRLGALVPESRGVYRLQEVARRPEHAWLATLVDGGPDALLTGEVACALLGLRRARRTAPALVVVPHGQVRGTKPGVVRTTRRPRTTLVRDPAGLVWPVAPLPRALADAVRCLDLERARALVGDALSSGLVDLRQLHHELSARGPRAPVVRAVLDDLAAGGVWSVPEGDLLDLSRTSSVLPVPETNVLLVDGEGRPVVRPDALWWLAALAASVDSREHHSDVRAWAETLARAAEAESRGLLVVHLTPAGLASQPRQHLLVLERHWSTRYGCGAPEGLERRRDVRPPRRG